MMFPRTTVDLILGSALLAFGVLGPWWLEVVLLTAAIAAAWLLSGRRTDSEHLAALAERTLGCAAAWVWPYHCAVFHHLATSLDHAVGRPERNRRWPVEALVVLLLLVSAWLSHVWSTFHPGGRVLISWFRPRWGYTIPAFAGIYVLLRFAKSWGGLRAEPSGLLDLPAGLGLLYWAARLADFRIHFFDTFLLSGLPLVALTTFFFYLTDMIDRKDAGRIALAQYGLLLLGGGRAFVVFLVVFSAYYLLRRGASEMAGGRDRSYRVYFEGDFPVYAAVPLVLLGLFVLTHRSHSAAFLTAFAASWIPLLGSAAVPLSPRFHEHLWSRLWPAASVASFRQNTRLSSAVLSMGLTVVYALVLVLLARLPLRILWLFPALRILGMAAGTMFRRLPALAVHPQGIWATMFYVITATVLSLGRSGR